MQFGVGQEYLSFFGLPEQLCLQWRFKFEARYFRFPLKTLGQDSHLSVPSDVSDKEGLSCDKIEKDDAFELCGEELVTEDSSASCGELLPLD